MKVCVGSKNQTKIDAIKEALLLYDEYKDAEIVGVGVESGVSDQPMSLSVIMKGSHNRAKRAFQECDLGVGVESGLMRVPQTESGYMDVSAVSIYDGDKIYTGFSPAIQLPKKIIDISIEKDIELSLACKEAGLTAHSNIGAREGFVGILTGGRMTRKDYTKYGFIMAMAYKENYSI